ncbi:hypothetical protein B5X24_HaOG200752 [Helicoverpa armigera]|nr:hypothetical protein B5X24_HaOG200752 [Helicoverpa armigera]
MADHLINLLTKTETIIGIYRNYDSLSKKQKILCKLRIFFEILFVFSIATYNVLVLENFLSTRIFHYMMMYHISNFLGGPIVAISGILCSNTYKNFIDNFMTMDMHYQKKSAYVKCLKKMKILFVVTCIISCLSIVFFLITKITARFFIHHHYVNIGFVLMLVVAVFVQQRFFLEHTLMYIFIRMIQNVLRCLNDCMLDAQVGYNDMTRSGQSDSREWRPLLTAEQVQLWAEHYKCLLICSKNLSICFRSQVI